jgi:hypothetical protein
MLTVLINAGVGVLAMLAFGLTGAANWGWSVFWGVLAFAAGQVGAGVLIQRRVKAGMGEIEAILKDGQRRLQAKVNQWQMRPPGSIKQAQIEMERDQRRSVERALEASKGLERFARWSPLMGRQIATMRLQLYWMLKEFKKVDELMPKALLMEPMMVAIKMARMQMTGATEGLDALFRKQARRLRYGQGALLYGLYSWILVQNQNPGEAHKVLIQACEKMENETIKRNREHLANNRVGQFSNAGLGEEWYALHLEEPKVKMQRQRPGAFGRPF